MAEDNRLTTRPPGGCKTAGVFPLCTEHASTLKEAGSEGRVYAKIGVRW